MLFKKLCVGVCSSLTFVLFSVNLGFKVSKTESYSKTVFKDGILIEMKVFVFRFVNNFEVRSLS
jgi:hypothetical protein